MTDSPHWLALLKRECARTSQARVAGILRDAGGDAYPSSSVVSQVCNDRYPGRTERLKALVEGVYRGIKVECPVYGEIGSDRCDAYQHAPYSGANPYRVAVYRACRSGCPYSRLEDET
jgi:hypothetical protein